MSKIIFFLISMFFYGIISSYASGSAMIKADSLLKAKEYEEAFRIYKDIEKSIQRNDINYSSFLWNFMITNINLEKYYRAEAEYDKAIFYGHEAVKTMKKGKRIFCKTYYYMELEMHRNLMISYLYIGERDLAEKHFSVLEKAHRKKQLPSELESCLSRF